MSINMYTSIAPQKDLPVESCQNKCLIFNFQADAKGKKKEETKAAPKVDAKVDEAWQMCSRCALVTLVSYLSGVSHEFMAYRSSY